MELPPELVEACQGVAQQKEKAVGILKFATFKECEKLAGAFEDAKRQQRTHCITSGTQVPWDQCLEFFEQSKDWTKERALKEDRKVEYTTKWADIMAAETRRLLGTPEFAKIKWMLDWDMKFQDGKAAYKRKVNHADFDYSHDDNINCGNDDGLIITAGQRMGILKAPIGDFSKADVDASKVIGRVISVMFCFGYAARDQSKKSLPSRSSDEAERLKKAELDKAQQQQLEQRVADRKRQEEEAERERQRKVAQDAAAAARRAAINRDNQIWNDWMDVAKPLRQTCKPTDTIGYTCYQYARLADGGIGKEGCTFHSALEVREQRNKANFGITQRQPMPDGTKAALGCTREVSFEFTMPELTNLTRYKRPQWFMWRCPDCKWPKPSTPNDPPPSDPSDPYYQHDRLQQRLEVRQLIDADFVAKVTKIAIDKRRRASEVAQAAASGDVVALPTKTRAQKDAEGYANAIDLDADADEATAAPSAPSAPSVPKVTMKLQGAAVKQEQGKNPAAAAMAADLAAGYGEKPCDTEDEFERRWWEAHPDHPNYQPSGDDGA